MLKNIVDELRVKPGAKNPLRRHVPDSTPGLRGDVKKDEAREELAGVLDRLSKLQTMLYAERGRSLLVQLQGMDASGKDGVISAVIARAFNMQGCSVVPFKAPTPIELEHDFLWRIHQVTPGSGRVVVTNRSQYEDVTTTVVHSIITEQEAKQRRRQIVQFEDLLISRGTAVVKVFLNISKDKQRERLQDRFDNWEEQWKCNPRDLDERKLWDAYQRLYNEVIGKTSTEAAPWYVVPADRKWYRNLAVAAILLHELQQIGPKFPPLPDDLRGKTILVE